MNFMCTLLFIFSTISNLCGDETNIVKFINNLTKPNILSPPLHQRPFVSVWNIDTSHCETKYQVEINLSSFDIISNSNETRDGDHMMIFYSSMLGLYPHFDDDGNPVNGGIPQLANLPAHLEKCVKDIETHLPHTDFRGLAVIDWESWRPMWFHNGWGKGKIYQEASMSKVRNEHPEWSQDKIRAYAKEEFEEAAKAFMLSTLRIAELIRPNGKWGFYKFPDCYNYAKNGTDFTCHNTTVKANDEIQWLFNGSSGLYPSTYLGIWFKNKPTAIAYTANRVNEAKRVDNNRPGHVSIPIYAYNNLVYRKTREFLTYRDIIDSSGVAAVLGASGVVLWGDYMSNSFEQCLKVKEYVETVLGPFLKFASDSASECSIDMCNGHGRCVITLPTFKRGFRNRVSGSMKMFLDLILPTTADYEIHCQCYIGFFGEFCEDVDFKLIN